MLTNEGKESMKQGNTGIFRAFKAMIYSYQGLVHAFKHESAFRQEMILVCVFVPFAFYLDVSGMERILMVASLVLVLIVELLNSAIEAVVDRVGLEHHELAGRAKDLGSAAVMLTLFLAAYIWLSILFL